MVVLSDNKLDFYYTRFQQKSYSEMANPHYHPYSELYYLISGTRKFFIGDTILTLGPGDLIMIPKNVVHRTTYISNDSPERITMSFSNRLEDRLVSDIGLEEFEALFTNYLIHVPQGQREYLEELFSRMNLENTLDDPFSKSMLFSYLEELIIFLARLKKHSAAPSMAILAEDQTISDAAKYITQHFSEPLTLESVANRFSTSPTYFSKKFKSQTGFGFKEYLTMVRSMEASKLLVNTKLSITEIADACGFDSSNYFGDAFKKSLGVSPRDFRKKHI